jgi:hypothetical protein
MASDKAAETRKIACTTTNKQEDFQTGCKGIVVVSDADCVIDFDQPCDAGSLLIKANQAPAYFPVQFTRLHAMTLSSTANLYVVALR